MNHKLIGDLLLLFLFVVFLQHTRYSMWTKIVLVAGDVYKLHLTCMKFDLQL